MEPEPAADGARQGNVLIAARRVAAGVTAGALAGLLVGGVGGRVAMLVLRLTSDPALHGATTDDGFTVGIVSGATVFLLMVTTFLGAAVGVLYLLVRGWLPERLRPWIAGVLGALVGGARIIRPDGIDFTLLDPRPLAIAMFVAIPAGVGIATSLLAERFLGEASPFRRSWVALASLVLLVPTLLLPIGVGLRTPLGLPLGIAAGAAVGLIVVAHRRRMLGRLWRSEPMAWLGRAVLVASAVVSSVELVRDVSSVL